MNSPYKAHLSMTAATLLFGINYWIAKGLMPEHLLPMQIIFLRVTGATVLFWISSRFLKTATNRSIAWKEFPRIGLAAFLGVTANQILFFKGLNLTSPSDTAIINASNPVMVMVLSSLLLKQAVRAGKIAGITLGAAGAVIMVLSAGNNTETGTLNGNLLILGNTLCWSLYLVVAKPLMERHHPFIVMRWIFLFGMLFSLPFTLEPFLGIRPVQFTTAVWFSVIYIIIGTTFLAYLFITYGLRKLSPTVVAYYTYVQPVIVAAIGIILFGERLVLLKIIALLLILAGVGLITRRE